MAWFSRKNDNNKAEHRGADASRDVAVAGGKPGERDEEDEADELEPPLRPVIENPGVEEQQRIASGRSALERAGVDVDDLAAIGAAFDAALTAWQGARRGERDDEREIVEQFAVAVGEHLHRHTDLRWARVTDAFGTDLAVAGGQDEFVVVPSNLVAARWMKAETGWLPGVVSHLVRVRADR